MEIEKGRGEVGEGSPQTDSPPSTQTQTSRIPPVAPIFKNFPAVLTNTPEPDK
jgi:hypothetical protein